MGDGPGVPSGVVLSGQARAPGGGGWPPQGGARHTYRCPLRWSDLDAYGHVNNVRFLTYLEQARIDFFDQLVAGGATPLLERGVLVSHHEISYLRPLAYRADPVPIDIWVTSIGGASFEVAYEVYDDSCCYARARTTVVSYDAEGDRPRRLTADQRAALAPYCAAATMRSASPA